MSLAVKPNLLKLTILCAGVLGLSLRGILLATGTDFKGLLVTGHWADIGVWLLTAAVIVLIFLLLRRCNGPTGYGDAFPPSFLRAGGSIVAACGILLSGDSGNSVGQLALIEPIARILAATALVAVAYCRLRGKKPSLLFHSAVCLYLALRMVGRYQVWSSNPQLQHYAFYLGAHLSLMLTCYQLAAFDADSGNHRILWSWGLAAVFLCLTALPGSEAPFFLLCCAFWSFTGLSNLTPVKGD